METKFKHKTFYFKLIEKGWIYNINVWPTHEGCVNYINSTPLYQIKLLGQVKIFNKCIIYQIHKTLSMLMKERTYVEYKRKEEK